MLKMVIRIDENKVLTEKKYRLDGIYSTINYAFMRRGFKRQASEKDALVYCGNGKEMCMNLTDKAKTIKGLMIHLRDDCNVNISGSKEKLQLTQYGYYHIFIIEEKKFQFGVFLKL